MSAHVVRFQQFFAAPPERVFDWFADHDNVGALFPGRTRRLRDAPAGNPPNGVDSAREVRIGLMRFEEVITRFERPQLIEYRVSQGWPLCNHVGQMRFEQMPGGTQLEFVIEFDSRLPFAGQMLTASLCRHWRRGAQRAVEGISQGLPA